MPFNVRELSLFSGEPIGLVRLARGNLVHRLATGDRDIEVDGELYIAAGGVEIGEIQESSQRAKNRLPITLPIDHPVVAWWVPYPPSQVVRVTCLAIHAGDTDFATSWTGRVLSPRIHDTKFELICEPYKAVNKSRGRNLRWQRNCGLAHYSQGPGMCNVDREAHRVAAVVTEFEGLMLKATAISALPVSRLAGGVAKWTRPDGEEEFRTIMSHLGDTVVLNYGADTVADDMAIVFYPGCKHTWDDCGYYENQDNYGGVLTIPVTSPHDGNPAL